ncbi:MAG: hypothetical protein MUC48_14275 [Leptolyngbya sp. Prado105]|nr:hypothetical protein [Leptolyngbya sp. Prado105]
MGDKRFAFVKNSINAAQNNPNILPASFDLKEFTDDHQLTLQLSELLIQLQQLEEQVNDTALSLGSDVIATDLGNPIGEKERTLEKSNDRAAAVQIPDNLI